MKRLLSTCLVALLATAPVVLVVGQAAAMQNIKCMPKERLMVQKLAEQGEKLGGLLDKAAEAVEAEEKFDLKSVFKQGKALVNQSQAFAKKVETPALRKQMAAFGEKLSGALEGVKRARDGKARVEALRQVGAVITAGIGPRER
ncbi:MAG: hypothetical protein ACE366_07970 [Bradymonadia bacterium]